MSESGFPSEGLVCVSQEVRRERGGAPRTGRQVTPCLDEGPKLVLSPSVQAEHDGNWDVVNGYAEGTPVVLTLSEDEHVLWVFGTYRTYIQQIVLYTSRPRDQYFGSLKGPNEFSDYPQNADHVLKGFCGFYVRGGLRAIKFVWGSASGTCTE